MGAIGVLVVVLLAVMIGKMSSKKPQDPILEAGERRLGQRPGASSAWEGSMGGSADTAALMQVAHGAARDPVCGMAVDPEHPKGGQFLHGGHTYRFCSGRCRDKFAAAPEKYPCLPLFAGAPDSGASTPLTERHCPLEPGVS